MCAVIESNHGFVDLPDSPGNQDEIRTLRTEVSQLREVVQSQTLSRAKLLEGVDPPKEPGAIEELFFRLFRIIIMLITDEEQGRSKQHPGCVSKRSYIVPVY